MRERRICSIEQAMKMRFLFAMLCAVLSGPTLAQTATPQDDIVVRGRREADRKAVQTYVANISVRSESQLARFHDSVCPVVVGLDRPYAAMVEQRIRSDAAAAGAPVAKKAKCSANLIVILPDDGAALVRDIRINQSSWLGGLDPAEVDALIAPAPARAWSVASLRNEDGGRQLGTILQVMSASILKQPTRQDIEVSFVIIDKAATMGLTLRQIADYAAMRGLAHTRPPAPGGTIDTILSLLDRAPTPPRELTDTDSAYLGALYASDGRDAAVTERNAITRRLAKGK
jgi:hypothetical protein